MAGETVRINELLLRVPGLSAEQGRRFGADVAESVAAELSEYGREEQLGMLHLRKPVAAGTQSETLADSIAKEILARLK